MREPPGHVADADVLAAVRAHWDADADDVEHLPVGFGAHHWCARVRGRPALFVTLDALAPHGPHTAESLEAVLGATATLAFRLDVVVASLPTHDLRHTVPLADGAVAGALSCTPWVWGENPPDDRATAEATARTLGRLHAVTPPPGVPRWASVVEADLAERVLRDLDRPWDGGPLGERARSAVASHADDLVAWSRRHRDLLPTAAERPWVPTHGEPHVRNQLVTPVRTLLVDWESLRLAPAERDLRWLEPALRPDADPGLLELFDLEWRLDEVARRVARLAGPHDGGPDDELGLGALLSELGRA